MLRLQSPEGVSPLRNTNTINHMITNPENLKPGQVVVFGGRIRRIVRAARHGYVDFKDSELPYSLSIRHLFWQIAEVEEPSFPNKVDIFFLSIRHEAYLISAIRFDTLFSPKDLLALADTINNKLGHLRQEKE